MAKLKSACAGAIALGWGAPALAQDDAWREAPPLFEAHSATEAPWRAPLDRASRALAAGHYGDAARLGVEGMSAWPEASESFALVARLGIKGLERQAAAMVNHPVAAAQPPAAPAPVAPKPAPAKAGPQRSTGLDVGLITGFRMEWAIPAPRVDAVGFRLGFGWASIYGDSTGTGAAHGYVDLILGPDPRFQLHLSQGFAPTPMVGTAFQYDPEGPLQMQAGVHFGVQGFAPEASVSWLWRRR